jgi:hypothetical protein
MTHVAATPVQDASAALAANPTLLQSLDFVLETLSAEWRAETTGLLHEKDRANSAFFACVAAGQRDLVTKLHDALTRLRRELQDGIGEVTIGALEDADEALALAARRLYSSEEAI